MTRRLHEFESQASRQTLAEGLAEYYAANPSLKRRDELSPAARDFFHSHDLVHVVYGCGTTMPDEAIVKLASMLGTTEGWSVLRGYRLHESLDIYRKLPAGDTVLALLLAPFLVIRTLWRCQRQTAPWPWQDHQHLMDMPLDELRARFGIRVAHGGNRTQTHGDPRLGQFIRAKGLWRGWIELPGQQTCPLLLCGSPSSPDADALASASRLPDALPAWRPMIEQALFEHYEPYGQADADDGDDTMPALRAAREVWAHTRLQYVALTRLRGELTVEFGYSVTWDPEHTLGARFQQDRFIELNGSVLAP